MKITERPLHIIGVPMDLGASRRGTDMGPSALRIAGLAKALQDMGYPMERQEDVATPAPETRPLPQESARYRDEILETCEVLCERVLQTLSAEAFPLVLGGDHSIAHGTVAGVSSYFRQQKKKLGLLWFDAHGDMNVPEHSPSGNIHGMPLAHILGYGDSELSGIGGFQGKVDPSHVALVGVRDIDPQERGLMKESGIHVFTMRDIDERGMAEVGQEVLSVIDAGTDGFHVSFDVDGLDPEVAPGSGTLVPGGVSFREAHLLLELCADTSNMVSMEVVELNPILDIRNETAERVKQLIQSAFGLSIL
mgnify:CR=1 FL=1